MSQPEFLNFIQNVVLVGLASFLGKVWATRISQKEQGEIKENILRLKVQLEAEQESFSRSLQHQNDLVKQLVQGASGEKGFIFEKQTDAVLKLWSQYLLIQSECGKFFVYHQIMPAAVKSQKAYYQKMPLLAEGQIQASLKRCMEVQAECYMMKPLIPGSIFLLFSGLVVFYARLGVHHLLSLQKGFLQPWYADDGDIDYSVTQLIAVAKKMNLTLPDLSDDPPGFDSWRGLIEEQFLGEIQSFLQGSLDRHLGMFKDINMVAEIKFDKKGQADNL